MMTPFHEKCDGKDNTVTIIKTDSNYVFGGFTAAKWSSCGDNIADSTAFLFSLRRKGLSCSHKFMVANANNTIYMNIEDMVIFFVMVISV